MSHYALQTKADFSELEDMEKLRVVKGSRYPVNRWSYQSLRDRDDNSSGYYGEGKWLKLPYDNPWAKSQGVTMKFGEVFDVYELKGELVLEGPYVPDRTKDLILRQYLVKDLIKKMGYFWFDGLVEGLFTISYWYRMMSNSSVPIGNMRTYDGKYLYLRPSYIVEGSVELVFGGYGINFPSAHYVDHPSRAFTAFLEWRENDTYTSFVGCPPFLQYLNLFACFNKVNYLDFSILNTNPVVRRAILQKGYGIDLTGLHVLGMDDSLILNWLCLAEQNKKSLSLGGPLHCFSDHFYYFLMSLSIQKDLAEDGDKKTLLRYYVSFSGARTSRSMAFVDDVLRPGSYYESLQDYSWSKETSYAFRCKGSSFLLWSHSELYECEGLEKKDCSLEKTQISLLLASEAPENVSGIFVIRNDSSDRLYSDFLMDCSIPVLPLDTEGRRVVQIRGKKKIWILHLSSGEDRFGNVIKALNKVFGVCRLIIVHNSIVDLDTLRSFGILYPMVLDTFVLSGGITNSIGLSLRELYSEYLQIAKHEKVGDFNWDLPSLDNLRYAARDVEGLFDVACQLWRKADTECKSLVTSFGICAYLFPDTFPRPPTINKRYGRKYTLLIEGSKRSWNSNSQSGYKTREEKEVLSAYYELGEEARKFYYKEKWTSFPESYLHVKKIFHRVSSITYDILKIPPD